MKKYIPIFLLITICLSACNNDSSSIADFEIVTSSIVTKTTGVETDTEEKEKLKSIATSLYTSFLNESKQNNLIKDYKIHDIEIEYINNDLFDFSVNYDVLSMDDDFSAGNGEIQDDGWVLYKYAYVVVKKNNDEYVIESQGTGKIIRDNS